MISTRLDALFIALGIYIAGAITGALMINVTAQRSYTELQMDLNEKLRMRDVGRGSMYVRR